MDQLLIMNDIKKSFGNVKSLSDAHFDLKAGEVHAILGANGAGKSTLMKILSGAYTADSGEIMLSGQQVEINSPKHAKDYGIFCVYQEVDTALVPQLTVADNIMLDSISSQRNIFVSKKRLLQQASKALALLDERISLQLQASELSLAEKQMVLIARALVLEAKVIIFDEPTAPLSLEETKKFFTIVNKLRNNGVGCIFISHRLPEIFEIANRITVMRDGRTISTFQTSQVTQQQIVETMLGSSFHFSFTRANNNKGERLLEIMEINDGQKVKDISFHVSKGEVVGIVGLVGAGKTELAKALFGLTKWKSGKVIVNGKSKKFQHPKEAMKSGLVLVPEERRKEGLFIQDSIAENITFPYLKKFSPFLFLNRKEENKYAEKIIDTLSIKANSAKTPVFKLSGGNQQKVAIGKWTSSNARVYLFDEPTKGVDIGAKQDIFHLIHNLTAEGKGIVYFSCEINEILSISDRILVMYDGQIVKELTKEEATQEKILLYASGGKEDIYERNAL
ncbi:sugar ABC transporter ATP-binding protein [Heyndrickxia acidicola]|uniref:Sugar ABC transporter ATP-binding protein n=1 Tax=Heyndrickxia acidicola TaxID=209389 RepID=A0ABU6ME62_9BACI|nr:sugar ABC transporter ATP-binding protein [Heyndrickxia acidicola]MED1202790.1 sugar ABC transporter ATP-binding protein [Heyndrickxia acidicola]